MYADVSKPPAPLPQPDLRNVSPGLKVLPPLTRSAQAGPGVIILVPTGTPSVKIEQGVPSLALKWAEEGYAVAEIQTSCFTVDESSPLKQAVQALENCAECSSTERVGIVAYDSASWQLAAPKLSSLPQIVAAVVYTDSKNSLFVSAPVPTLLHVAGQSSNSISKPLDGSKMYQYPSMKTSGFALPFSDNFHYTTEAISHTRSLTFLKPKLGGPYFDLESIWDEHCYYEFADRSVQHTMSTMVQEPYVNHVPTITGGIGRNPLSEFYRDDFIYSNSSDAELELLSRTVGIDRIVDEFIFKYTHTQEIPWMLPGVPPTGLRVETPFTAVVNIRGDRLYHEHIAWDQASVLKQLGLLPDYLPFPYKLPNGEVSKHAEYRLPVAGSEVTQKMRDRNSLPSNHMFEYKYRLTDTQAGDSVRAGSDSSYSTD